jgi:hypothetical protein
MGFQFALRDISPGAVILDYGPSGHENLEVRPTLGTINVNDEEQVAPVHEEEFGDAPVSHVSKGSLVSVEVPFTRLTLRQLNKIFPYGTELKSADVLIFKNDVGNDYFLESTNMVIRPIVKNVLSTDPSEWLEIYHVHPRRSWVLGYDRESQRVTNIVFECYPKQHGDNIGDFYQFGV